ncbi:pentapeptide repeat-containing protein [Haliangium sp. UPWRP_2]|uniref:pentapeptide repeat-containing protein n=1 Tax=Haliangium sp. UPWRP_2 TaxID=1931276 RepID=UPI000B53B7B9|nr:pentapeptide repeat-containing protein [Haliangium sp. UPWRP_2]PSM32306.1 hypothetical protein BVG81_000915 [Haliangium sp. UPWRP_2]
MTSSLRPPTRSSIRNALRQLLRTASDFDAFVLENHYSVYIQFGNNMDRTKKETLLLEKTSTSEILEKVRDCYPHETSKFEPLLRYNPTLEDCPQSVRRDLDKQAAELTSSLPGWISRCTLENGYVEPTLKTYILPDKTPEDSGGLWDVIQREFLLGQSIIIITSAFGCGKTTAAKWLSGRMAKEILECKSEVPYDLPIPVFKSLNDRGVPPRPLFDLAESYFDQFADLGIEQSLTVAHIIDALDEVQGIHKYLNDNIGTSNNLDRLTRTIPENHRLIIFARPFVLPPCVLNSVSVRVLSLAPPELVNLLKKHDVRLYNDTLDLAITPAFAATISRLHAADKHISGDVLVENAVLDLISRGKMTDENHAVISSASSTLEEVLRHQRRLIFSERGGRSGEAMSWLIGCITWRHYHSIEDSNPEDTLREFLRDDLKLDRTVIVTINDGLLLAMQYDRDNHSFLFGSEGLKSLMVAFFWECCLREALAIKIRLKDKDIDRYLCLQRELGHHRLIEPARTRLCRRLQVWPDKGPLLAMLNDWFQDETLASAAEGEAITLSSDYRYRIREAALCIGSHLGRTSGAGIICRGHMMRSLSYIFSFRQESFQIDAPGLDAAGSSFRGMDGCVKNLENSNLDGADFEMVDFTHANLRGASLRDTNLRQARLQDADYDFEAMLLADIHDATFGARGLTEEQQRQLLARGANLYYEPEQEEDLTAGQQCDSGEPIDRARRRGSSRGSNSPPSSLDTTD